jgi:hypothetical protein
MHKEHKHLNNCLQMYSNNPSENLNQQIIQSCELNILILLYHDFPITNTWFPFICNKTSNFEKTIN